MDEIQDRAESVPHANGTASDGAVAPPAVAEQRGSNGGYRLGGVTGKGFLPGQSGNPTGQRRKGRSMTSILCEILEGDEIAGKKTPDGRLVKELMVESVLKAALKGGARQQIEILNRYDGKVPDHHEHSGPAGGPIAFNATVCGMSDEQVTAWREKKRAEIAARSTGPPP